MAGEVQDGFAVWECEAVGRGDLVDADLSLCGLQRPGDVVDIACEHAAGKGSKEGVSLREEVLQRTGSRYGQDWSGGGKRGCKADGLTGELAPAAVVRSLCVSAV